MDCKIQILVAAIWLDCIQYEQFISPRMGYIIELFTMTYLHYLHVKCCLVHHRKLNHGRFCISIWILRQKLRLINNKILFCIFCNEFYCCCWRISEPAPASISADPGPGVTLCLPNQFQPSKSNNNHVIVIKISHFTSRAGEARYSRESPAWY